MKSLRKLTATVLLAALAATTVIGCGQLPTSPAPAQNQAMQMPSKVIQSEGLIGDAVGGLLGLIVKVLHLVGSVGGSLSNGRWTVVIPPNAVSGDGTVSLGVASTSSPQCALEISPASLNHFSKPVTLTVNCGSVSSYQLKTYVIYWLDPSTNQWVEVPGSKVDLIAKTVSAPLQHFSQYCVGPSGGRAGW